MEMSIFQWNKLNNGPPPPLETMRKWRAATGKKLILGEAIQSRFVYSIPAFPRFVPSPLLQLIPSIVYNRVPVSSRLNYTRLRFKSH